jgi:alanine dehydrogenase
MHVIKVGLIREGKVPPDKRVPFTPIQVEEICQRFANVKVYCQQSAVRCFHDSEYEEVGAEILSSIEDCDILME